MAARTTRASAAEGAGVALRPGFVQKRQAILDAARDLFVTEGFERTSMDALSQRAGVSKRTVYDYYGDKRALLVAVVDAVGRSLVLSVQEAIDAHLASADGMTTIAELETALIATARQIASTTVGSSDYAAFTRLITNDGAHVPEAFDGALQDAPEEAMAEAIARFAASGLLEAPDARLAADHFNALTVLLAINSTASAGGSLGDNQFDRIIVEGVRAFLRAYRSR